MAAAALTGTARAEVCGPAVALDGDHALVARVATLLATRGIALDPTSCPAIRARLTWRGAELVVAVDGRDGSSTERVVTEASTAATVIESFSRLDIESTLLAIRDMPSSPAVAEIHATAPPAVQAPRQPAARGVQVFGVFETSLASDRTTWLGASVGACVMLGPVCAAARLRVASVLAGPDAWQGQLERRSTELFVGIDIPFAVHGMTLSPGFAAGLGQMHTRGELPGMRSETGGVRADVHATLAIPFRHQLALELFTAADLTQETRIESGSMMGALPAEPRALVRVGVGLRYGGL
jgi:hypothetical protein